MARSWRDQEIVRHSNKVNVHLPVIWKQTKTARERVCAHGKIPDNDVVFIIKFSFPWKLSYVKLTLHVHVHVLQLAMTENVRRPRSRAEGTFYVLA